jgi:hypothetical protein
VGINFCTRLSLSKADRYNRTEPLKEEATMSSAQGYFNRMLPNLPTLLMTIEILRACAHKLQICRPYQIH